MEAVFISFLELVIFKSIKECGLLPHFACVNEISVFNLVLTVK